MKGIDVLYKKIKGWFQKKFIFRNFRLFLKKKYSLFFLDF